MNESRIKACVSRYDSDAYNTLQLLRAVSHAVGVHTEALQPSQDADSSDDDDDVMEFLQPVHRRRVD